MSYQLYRDFYLVTVDSIWEKTATKSGIITSHIPHIDQEEEVVERGEYKRRYGRVLELPLSFSDNDFETIAPSNPAPRAYVGHDWIAWNHRRGQRGYRDHEDPRSKYYPSTFERYESTKFSSFNGIVDIKQNDLVYFDHQATDMDRYMGKYGDQHMFSIRVDEILAVFKKGPVFINHEHYVKSHIYPQGHWVFVEINMESWADITLPSGIIMKVAPQALPLQGKVIAARRKELIGKNILFERDADAPITIDDKDLTCMPESDILATLK